MNEGCGRSVLTGLPKSFTGFVPSLRVSGSAVADRAWYDFPVAVGGTSSGRIMAYAPRATMKGLEC